MGNCICAANNKVMSQETEDDSRAPSAGETKGAASAALIKPPEEDRVERKKIKVEKKVRFKLEDDQEEGRDPGKGGVRRVRVVVTKEELRQILRHARGSHHSSSSSSSGSSLEELMVALRSRGEERIGDGLGGKGDTSWRPGLESIPEHRRR
ncbi:hypothetical protein MLD38_009121 [Melastoma candidum]|uniref:Uncharacterized protein n=1 Tax=Melastoma candidum TaxID=119954 RepID=A0ACB9RWH4_9MYRT|nr:hypothetical protein MLD38_009121 [Melastoma candidum]